MGLNHVERSKTLSNSIDFNDRAGSDVNNTSNMRLEVSGQVYNGQPQQNQGSSSSISSPIEMRPNIKKVKQILDNMKAQSKNFRTAIYSQ